MIMAATARPEPSIRQLLDQVRFDAVTTLNGARILLPGRVLEHAIPAESGETVLGRLLAVPGLTLSVETGEGIFANVPIPAWHAVVYDGFPKLPAEPLYKILVSDGEGTGEGLYEQVQGLLTEDTYWHAGRGRPRAGDEPARDQMAGDCGDAAGFRDCGGRRRLFRGRLRRSGAGGKMRARGRGRQRGRGGEGTGGRRGGGLRRRRGRPVYRIPPAMRFTGLQTAARCGTMGKTENFSKGCYYGAVTGNREDRLGPRPQRGSEGRALVRFPRLPRRI